MPEARMQVPLVGIQQETAEVESALLEALSNVVRSGRFVLGPVVQRFEQQIAQLLGVHYAVGCASGSDALLLALMALGVGPGDEVIVPSFTFFATASAVVRLGAQVVFADIEPEGFTLDPDDVAQCITPRTKAIVPVHLFGQCAAMDRLQALAQEHQLALVEDAAQAMLAMFGSRYAGAMGTLGCFSFYPTKNLGGLGDGGLVVTNDPHLAHRVRLLRVHGMEVRYRHEAVGINSRLDALQAAALLVKLPHLPRWTQRREENAARYQALVEAYELDRWVQVPRVLPGRRHVWNQFVIRVPAQDRDALREHLARCGVATEIYYPVPLHQQPCFADSGHRPLPRTEQAAVEVLALPIFPHLDTLAQKYVVECMAEYFSAKRPVQVPRPKFLDAPVRSAREKTPTDSTLDTEGSPTRS